MLDHLTPAEREIEQRCTAANEVIENTPYRCPSCSYYEPGLVTHECDKCRDRRFRKAAQQRALEHLQACALFDIPTLLAALRHERHLRAELDSRIAELERLNLEAQHRIADLCVLIGNIEQCRAVEGDSVTILCDNPEADNIETQGVVEVCGDYTGYDLERFYGPTWEDAIAKAARVAQRHYAHDSDIYE